MEANDLVIKLLTDFRADMNARFEQLDQRLDKRFGEVEKRFADHDRRFEAIEKRQDRMEQRLNDVHLDLSRQIAALAATVHDELIFGRRELSARVDKCEREIDELKRRAP